MLGKLMRPIAELHGQLSTKSPFYARMLNGKLVIQRKPNRSGHQPSPAQVAARQTFGITFGTARKKPPNKTLATNNVTTTLPLLHLVHP